MKLVAGTSESRSGDRVRNGMVIGALSLTGLAIILDPYISKWMEVQTSEWGIVFADPEAWKDAMVQFAVAVLTGLWGTVHMMLIRLADRVFADATLDAPRGIGGQRLESTGTPEVQS